MKYILMKYKALGKRMATHEPIVIIQANKGGEQRVLVYNRMPSVTFQFGKNA